MADQDRRFATVTVHALTVLKTGQSKQGTWTLHKLDATENGQALELTSFEAQWPLNTPIQVWITEQHRQGNGGRTFVNYSAEKAEDAATATQSAATAAPAQAPPAVQPPPAAPVAQGQPNPVAEQVLSELRTLNANVGRLGNVVAALNARLGNGTPPPQPAAAAAGAAEDDIPF